MRMFSCTFHLSNFMRLLASKRTVGKVNDLSGQAQRDFVPRGSVTDASQLRPVVISTSFEGSVLGWNNQSRRRLYQSQPITASFVCIKSIASFSLKTNRKRQRINETIPTTSVYRILFFIIKYDTLYFSVSYFGLKTEEERETIVV